MRTAESRIETAQASRYLTQLCQHAKKFSSKFGHGHLRALHGGGGGPRPEIRQVDSTDTDGTLTLSWGTCTLHATPDALTVHVTAETDENLVRIQELITADLERFGRREDLTVTWTPVARPS